MGCGELESAGDSGKTGALLDDKGNWCTQGDQWPLLEVEGTPQDLGTLEGAEVGFESLKGDGEGTAKGTLFIYQMAIPIEKNSCRGSIERVQRTSHLPSTQLLRGQFGSLLIFWS